MTTCIFDDLSLIPTALDPTRPCAGFPIHPDADHFWSPDGAPLGLRLSFGELTSVKNYLHGSQGSASWPCAEALTGPRITSIVKTLLNMPDWEFPAAIYERFCPACLQPAEWTENPYRIFDLAIRAVHAHALLGRFYDYLQYIQDLPCSGTGDDHDEFEPNDLLAAMVRCAVADRHGHARYGRAHRAPNSQRMEHLFRLISNEAAQRLNCERQPAALSHRVKKHLPQFQDLVSLAQRP
jgi:hypothetical protein